MCVWVCVCLFLLPALLLPSFCSYSLYHSLFTDCCRRRCSSYVGDINREETEIEIEIKAEIETEDTNGDKADIEMEIETGRERREIMERIDARTEI